MDHEILSEGNSMDATANRIRVASDLVRIRSRILHRKLQSQTFRHILTFHL